MDKKSEEKPAARALWTGVLGWTLFAVFAVALRGVRWEETYEHGLTITGIAAYPEGHPTYRYCRNIFSVQCYFSALLVWLADVPVLINGLRNVLQLFFTVVPVFLLGARLGNHVRYGHMAAILVLLGVHQNFQSFYPIEPWPYAYGNGQIGVGFALLVLAMLLFERWRTAWFMLGLLVAIHLGQLPVVGAMAGSQWLVYLYRREWRKIVDATLYFALGLIPCFAFYLVKQQFHVSAPETGAYAVEGDIHAIWTGFTEYYDLHRGNPRFNPFWKSWIACALALLLAGAPSLRKDGKGRVGLLFGWLACYSAIVIVIVGGIWTIHQGLGKSTPFLLIGWMPYRLTNHLAILLVPLCLGIIHHTTGDDRNAKAGSAVTVSLILLYALLMPLWRLVVPETLYVRYINNPEGLLFSLCGLSILLLFLAYRRTGRRPYLWGALVAGMMCYLAIRYPFGAACMVAGASCFTLVNLFLLRSSRQLTGVHFAPVWLGIAVVVLMLFQQFAHREHLPIHPLHVQVLHYLEEHGESNTMIVTPYWDIAWTPKTRLATFSDYMVPTYLSYMPDLGPSLKKMYLDVYGRNIDAPSGPPLEPWPDRTPEEWRRLGEAYGFKYVLAPSEMNLALSPVLVSRPYSMYNVVP
jgi:hypothetical protein